MKKTLSLLILALSAVAAPITLTAQTINFNLGSQYCGNFTGTYRCDGIPVTNTDGSQPVPANEEPAFVFSNLVYNTQLNGFFFLGNYGLDPLGGKNVVDYTDATVPNSSPLVHKVVIHVKGSSENGGSYTGTVTYLYTVATAKTCAHSGRVTVCTTPWTIEGGTGTIIIKAAGTNGPTPDSPIAPTPVCFPGDPGCPPHKSN
jgi:hypothetical protein